MYFFSGEAMCETVSPARAEISSNLGTRADELGFCALLAAHTTTNMNADAVGKMRFLLRLSPNAPSTLSCRLAHCPLWEALKPSPRSHGSARLEC